MRREADKGGLNILLKKYRRGLLPLELRCYQRNLNFHRRNVDAWILTH